MSVENDKNGRIFPVKEYGAKKNEDVRMRGSVAFDRGYVSINRKEKITSLDSFNSP